MLKICEMFTSIQGESSYAGLLFQFIRLTGCNLRCSYCDTQYAYEEGEEITQNAIFSHIRKSPIMNVLITGGEPLLQEETTQLASNLLKADYTVLVETNGSLDIGVLPEGVCRILDLKCPSSGQEQHNRWQNTDLLTDRDEVKFVIGNHEDYMWAKDVVFNYGLFNRCHVLFSPVFSVLAPGTLADWMIRDSVPARLNLQLHKLLWPGRDRGV